LLMSGITVYPTLKTPEDASPDKKGITFDIDEEEKRLMQGSKNVENKDDFWITLSQELQEKNEDEETRLRRLEKERQFKVKEEIKKRLGNNYEDQKIKEAIK
jgi:hypothetical protein